MKALRFTLFVYLFMQLTTGQAYAADVGYEVEVIIFEDTTGVYEWAETWTLLKDDADTPEPAEASRNNKKQFKPLSSDKYRLNSQAERLVKHPDYRVLVHTAWKQPGLDREQAFSVPVNSLQTSGIRQDAGGDQAGGGTFVNGDITLIMSRYLHINAQLFYNRPVQQDSQQSLSFTNQGQGISSVSTPQYETYPVKFERRMRSREIHYLDHPMVGMIVLATPFKIETKGPSTKPGGYQTL